MIQRRAALARISAWHSGGGRFLLVTGSMGSGKSVLVGQLVAALERTSLVCAAHYCQADNAPTIAVGGLLRSWSGRLGRRLPGYVEDLARAGNVHITGTAFGPRATGVRLDDVAITIGDEAPADAFLRTIARPLERLAAAGALPRVLLVVDGVEEARDADGHNRVLALLAGLTGAALPAGVAVVATSRPEHLVRVALEGVDQLDLDAVGAADVTEYIALRTRPDRRLAARLTEQVRGNFLLAASILDELGDRALVEIPTLPRTLPGIFRKRLWRLVDEHDREQLDVLGLLAIARAPVGEATIAMLLDIERHRVRAAVNRILPVLAPDPARRYRLVHRALAEFLLDPEENPLPVPSAGALHAGVAERMCRIWGGRWELCDEPYAIDHVVAHLTLAGERDLAGLLGDPGFLQAKAALAGVDGLHADLRFGRADLLERLLLSQAHQLRGWEPARSPGLFAQQLLHAAVLAGNDDLATVFAEHLDRHKLAHLRLRWGHSSPRLVHVMVGHVDAITALAVTPDGSRAVTASEDGTARVWTLDTGAVLHVLTGHGTTVTCVAIDLDGAQVATGAKDGTVRMWDVDTGRLLHSLDGAEDRLSALAFTTDGAHVVGASWDRTVRVWSVQTGHETRVMRGHQGPIHTLRIVADRRAVTTGDDGTRRLWDLDSGRQLEVGHWPDVSPSLRELTVGTLTPDWNHSITGSPDGTARLWDLRAGGGDGHRGAINAIVPTAAGRRLITGSDDGTARVWDAGTGKELGVLDGGGWVTAVAASADGTLAVTANWDGVATVWELPAGRSVHTLAGHTEQITGVAVVADGSLAVTGSWDHTVRICQPRTGRLVHTLRGHEDWVTAVALPPPFSRVISASTDRTARIWDVHTGLERHVCPHRAEVPALAVTPDGTRFVTAARDGVARVWDSADGTLVHTLAGHEGAIVAVAVDDARIVTGSEDGTAAVWDLRHGEHERTLEGHSGPITAVALDGDRIVTGSADRTVRVWDSHGELTAGLPDAVTRLVADPREITVGTAAGGLFRYRVAGHVRRTTATPNGMSARVPEES